jgi:hypothetical protein
VGVVLLAFQKRIIYQKHFGRFENRQDWLGQFSKAIGAASINRLSKGVKDLNFLVLKRFSKLESFDALLVKNLIILYIKN